MKKVNYNIRTVFYVPLFIIWFFFSSSSNAAKPIFIVTPITPAPNIIYPGKIVTSTYQIINNTPYTLNNNGVVHLPRGVTLVGGSCTSPYFNLASNSSCTIVLQITANELAGNVVGGPLVCNTPDNLIYCSKPSLKNQLNITKSLSTLPVIIATPLALNLTQAGPSAVVTVTNTSQSIEVENLQAMVEANSAITIDSLNTTCTTTLAPQTSCNYSFLPGNQTEVSTTITIKGTDIESPVIINATVSEVQLNVSPESLTFAVNSTGLITVTNTSNGVANNLQVVIPSNSNLSYDSSSSCIIGGSLLPTTSCSIVLTTPPNVAAETGTLVTVSGNNTNTPAVAVNTTATTLSIISPSTIQTLNVDGISTLSIIVSNSGTTDATNVSMSSPWSGVNFNPSTCGTISANGGTCSFTISTARPNLAGMITVKGTNTNSITTPYIAFSYQGGLVFSISGTSPNAVAKIVNNADLGSISGSQWSLTPDNPSGVGAAAQSLTNGVQNTAAIVSKFPDGSNQYAANICSTYTGSSYTDWYLPAICEWSNLSNGCSIANIYAQLKVLGFGNLAGFYWSSSESTSGPNFNAWRQTLFFSGGNQVAENKLISNQIRCARQIVF